MKFLILYLLVYQSNCFISNLAQLINHTIEQTVNLLFHWTGVIDFRLDHLKSVSKVSFETRFMLLSARTFFTFTEKNSLLGTILICTVLKSLIPFDAFQTMLLCFCEIKCFELDLTLELVLRLHWGIGNIDPKYLSKIIYWKTYYQVKFITEIV
jgi:hypothetical protein